MIRAASVKTLVVLLLLATAAACSRAQGESSPVAAEPTTVRVENQAWLDVTVYAVYSSTRTRLGTVSASSTSTLRIPPRLVGIGRALTFLVDPVGSSATGTSFEIYVNPGDNVAITVPSSLGR